MDARSFSELMVMVIALADEVGSIARDSEIERDVFEDFAVLVDRFSAIFSAIEDQEKVMDTPPIRKAVGSLENELRRARLLLKSLNMGEPIKQLEELARDIGRSLGLVLFASLEASVDLKQKIAALYRELMNVKFNLTPSLSTGSEEYVSTSEMEDELKNDVKNEIEEEGVCLDTDDILLQLKYGKDEEFSLALLGFNGLLRSQSGINEWIYDEGIIPLLFNRLGSSTPSNRLTIIQILRNLALETAENKEKMVDVGSLSVLVKSLTRDVEERRQAVGLLLDLSDLPAVRRQIGRIQGCIFMLVAMLNGDDPVASRDAVKVLNGLSGNNQNALHMAEAGYFKPLVHYLKEGSDMSKILMATALSRMELTDQSKAALGKDGAIEPLVKMFNGGKLEAKLSALNALQNLSSLTDNIQRLISSGIVVSLLQLLFSVTSVLMTLREPVSGILARIAQSENILVNHDIAQKMLSLLNLSSPVIQNNLFQALNSIAAHPSASKVRRKMNENGAIQLILPFLTETNTKIRRVALNLIYSLSKDLPGELIEQLGETHVHTIVDIISSSTSENEKAAALGILSNVPVSDKKTRSILKKANLLPRLISILSSISEPSTPELCWLGESIACILIWFTVSSDKKLQLSAVEQGVIPLLMKLLSSGSPLAKCRAALSLAQLSQNTPTLRKAKTSRWFCIPPSAESFCDVHDGYCFVNTTFCIVKAGAIPLLVQILEGKEREADEAVLDAFITLLQDEIWENGSNFMAKSSCIEAVIKVLESGTVKAQEKALWILEKNFRIQEHRENFGASAQAVLIDLAQNGEPMLKSTTAKILAELELLQDQSSYF